MKTANSAVFMRFLASQKRNKRFIHGHFQPFLPQKPHGYCAIAYKTLTQSLQGRKVMQRKP
jgi:hypothetical protein